jgi:4-hydroxy-tetrahydrodipicolinate synthase
MDLPHLHGIIPPLATPLRKDESIDVEALEGFVEFQIDAGVHGLWILGTTGRFDLIPDDAQRVVAETAAEAAGGAVPMVLNVSDQGTKRTIARARMFDDLPYDYYAVLPPWYQSMTPGEVTDYFVAVADELAKPIVIYNAPWVCNQLSFDNLRKLAEHPRIAGCKDVTPSLTRTLDWPESERRRVGFSYLHGNDLLALSTELGADGFVTSLSNPFPELAVALWDSARAGNAARAFRLQSQLMRLARITGFGPVLACLEVACRHRGVFDRMLPRPLRPISPEVAERVIAILEAEGFLPEDQPSSSPAPKRNRRASTAAPRHG